MNLKYLLRYECTRCSPSFAELDKNIALFAELREVTKIKSI